MVVIMSSFPPWKETGKQHKIRWGRELEDRYSPGCLETCLGISFRGSGSWTWISVAFGLCIHLVSPQNRTDRMTHYYNVELSAWLTQLERGSLMDSSHWRENCSVHMPQCQPEGEGMKVPFTSMLGDWRCGVQCHWRWQHQGRCIQQHREKTNSQQELYLTFTSCHQREASPTPGEGLPSPTPGGGGLPSPAPGEGLP